tara:strand:- start:388 stop:735 length:348 start_codon:yes stop_codon:yes gene_type:complete
MPFKLSNPPYKEDLPVYQANLGKGILGQANKNGTVLVNSELDPKFHNDVISHEKVHIDQMMRGDLDYDDKNIYWKGKAHSKKDKKIAMASPSNSPWEAEAYMRSGTKYKDSKYNV